MKLRTSFISLKYCIIPVFMFLLQKFADHGGRAGKDMNCLRSLERWDRGFESNLRHGCLCMRLLCVCVVLCVCSGLATG
jgi:hypothetical protein